MIEKKREKRTDENSVNVALNELMGLEDERQRIEEKERRREEEAREAARLEEEERRRLEEEERRKAEEEARLEAERAAREEERRKSAERRERELRIRAEAQAAAMAREQAALMEKELDLKRVEASHRKAPPWFWPVAAVLFLGIAGVGGVVYANVTSSAENQVREAKRDLEASRERAQERLRLIRIQFEAAQAERDAARARVSQLERTNNELQEANRKLQIASETSRTPKRGGRVRTGSGGSSAKKDDLGGLTICDNPAGCDGELDDLPLSTKKKKKAR